jgi:hypothetical protein
MQAISRYKHDPAARQTEIEVNDFNARAVKKVRPLGEVEEVLVFEKARHKFIGLVKTLSEADFKDERVLNLEDHRIP